MKIDARFIESNAILKAVYAYCYTGTQTPSVHDKSEYFFNTDDGTYSVHTGSEWGTPTQSGTKKFLSLTDGKIYSIENGEVAKETPEDDTLYFAAMNSSWYYCLDGVLYLAGTANSNISANANGTSSSDASGNSSAHYDHAPDRPTILSPSDNEKDICQAPQIHSSEYSHYFNSPMYGRQIQISTSDAFRTTVYDLTESSQSTVFQIPLQTNNNSYLSAGTKYYARVRYQDKDQNWSEWSPTICFTTCSKFPDTVLQTPMIIMPVDGGLIPDLDPLLAMSSPIALVGDAEFSAAEWQIATDKAFSSQIYTASDTEKLTLHETSVDLAVENTVDFYVRGRQKTSGGFYTPWSAPAHVIRQPRYDKLVFGMRRIFSSTPERPYIYQLDEDGNEIQLPRTYFERHPLYSFPIHNLTISGDITSTVAYLQPCWIRYNVYDNDDGDMVIDLWFSPTPKIGDGWMLHPAFTNDPNGIYIATCLSSMQGNYAVSAYGEGAYLTNLAPVSALINLDPTWHVWSIYEHRLLFDLMQAEYGTFGVSAISSGTGISNTDASFSWRGFRSLIGNLHSNYSQAISGFQKLSSAVTGTMSSFTLISPAGNGIPLTVFIYITANVFTEEIFRGYEKELGFDIAILGITSKTGSVLNKTTSSFGSNPAMTTSTMAAADYLGYRPDNGGLFVFCPGGGQVRFSRLAKRI